MTAGLWSGHPLLAGMMLGIVLVAGVVSVPLVAVLPASERPASWVDLSLNVEGHTADAVDRHVAGRVEELLRTVRGVRALRSVCERERLWVRAECSPAVSLARVRAAIAGRLLSYCERAGTGISVERIGAGISGGSSGERDFLRIGVWGRDERHPPSEDVRGTIVPALLAVPGVADVGLEGEERRAVVLTPRREVVVKHHVSSASIAAAVFGYPPELRIGMLPVGSRSSGRRLGLSECAVIREAVVPQEVVWRIDGRAAVVVSVRRRPETDPARLAEGIGDALRACRQALASPVRWVLLEDPSRTDRERIAGVSWLAVMSVVLLALAAAWYARSWRASFLALVFTGCLSSGLLVVLALAGKTLGPATIGGAVLGFVFHVPWICGHLLSRSPGGGLPGGSCSVIGAAAGLALILLSKFTGHVVGSGELADAGIGLTAVCGAGFLARPVEVLRGAATNRPRVPASLLKSLAKANGWCRRQRGLVLGAQMLILGIPLWLIPRELPRGHPFFRLHLISFGSALYREHRPMVEQLLGGIVYQIATTGLGGGDEEDPGEAVVQATVDLPPGSSQETAAAAVFPLEARARAIVQERARVITSIAAERAAVRVEFGDAPRDASLPVRVSEALRGVATGLGNVRVAVLGTGPGFQSGQAPLPSMTVELRGYDRRIMELAAEGFRRYLEADQRVHEVDLLASGGGAEREHELHLLVDPRGPGGGTVASVAQAFLGHAAVSSVQGTDRRGRPILLKVGESIGDTLEIAGRGPGGAARALKNVVSTRAVEVAHEIVREQREYVRRISCVFDAPPEIAREILAGYCGSFPIPPGCRLVMREGSDPRSSGLMSALGWGVVLAVAVSLLAATALGDSGRAGLAMAASVPAAGTGVGLALILVSPPGGVWVVCACGAVMIACGTAALYAGHETGNEDLPPSPAPPTAPLEQLFGCWVLQIAALAPFALVPLVLEVPVAFHAGAFALVSGIGITAGLVLVLLTVPALESDRHGTGT